jgi:hypothetical protein
VILLELTEQEAEIVRNGILLEQQVRGKEDRTDYDNKVSRCDKILFKLWAAKEPQKDVLIGPKDLVQIVSTAKSQHVFLPANLYISNKKVEEEDFRYISLANSLILWLNGKELLKKLVRFDITDLSNEFEETEE